MKQLVVAGLLARRDVEGPTRIMVARRWEPGTSRHGLWYAPGGKVDDGERVLDALIREFREEFGIGIDLNYHHSLGEFDQHPEVDLRAFYILKWTGNPRPARRTGNAAIEWVTIDHALSLPPMSPAFYPIVLAFQKQGFDEPF